MQISGDIIDPSVTPKYFDIWYKKSPPPSERLCLRNEGTTGNNTFKIFYLRVTYSLNFDYVEPSVSYHIFGAILCIFLIIGYDLKETPDG
ncbi:hypothetical protein B0A70_05865 [Chryseobacterium piscicola]|uniref:Uncharacterized protein n=1 Tax=Chryseobacterium piscicola TaxID=551459 RepID=A0A2S7KGM6_9FLAO|nr:hypothetical protein B0A70_05865 [Chryseobacterium piscicola]